jgi:hypothetical protein
MLHSDCLKLGNLVRRQPIGPFELIFSKNNINSGNTKQKTKSGFYLSQTFKIIFLSNLSILSVPEEGYSERTLWRLFWAYLRKVILSVPEEGYSTNASCALYLNICFYYYHSVDTSAGGLLVRPQGIIRPVVGVPVLKWFIRYIYYWNLQLLNM